MQLPAVLAKIGILGSVIVGVSVSGQALAADPYDNSVLCAAYMDIAVEDLYPLGAIPHAKAKEMLVGRFTRLASVSLQTKEPVSNVVSRYIDSRDRSRRDLLASSGLNSMRLYSSDEIFNHAQALDTKTAYHCNLSNQELESVVKKYSQADLVTQAVAVSSEIKKRGEK